MSNNVSFISKLEEEDERFIEEKSNDLVEEIMKRKSVVFNQNKEQVKHLVKECVRHADESIKEELKHMDTNRTRKEFHYLKETIFGICDGDNKSNNTQIENVFYTRFYSYENYLLNPINLFLFLSWEEGMNYNSFLP